MTRNTTENIPGVAEAANAQKPKQDTEDLRVRSYKAFVNFQMKQRNAPDFVASFRTSTSATA